MNAAFYVGTVMHQRLRPFRHRFAYRAFTCLFDLDRLPELAAGLRLFAHNAAAPLSLHDRDHGPRDGAPLRPWVEQQLAAAGIPLRPARIELLCLPRVFGYVFNPLSIYFCHAEGRVQAVIYEVRNTFGGQHTYVLPVASGDDGIRQQAAKRFYVSPFLAMAGGYRFRVQGPGAALSVAIQQHDAAGVNLVAIQRGRRRPFNDRQIAAMLLRFPLLTLQVMFGIHWQALRLWFKGAPRHSRPAAT